MMFFKKVLFLIIIILSPWLSFAQKDYKQFYTIDNLLSKELIKSISKDEEGYLWIATDDGILRYDGYQTKIFFKELPSHYTKGFLKRKNGKFYVLHDTGILEIVNINDSILFKPLTINNVEFNEHLNFPKSAYEDISGNLWIGEFNTILRYDDKGFKRFNLGDEFTSIDYHRTFSFAEDAFGNLWVAPFKGPLLYYDKQKQEFIKMKLSVNLTEVGGITAVKGDYLLIGGKEGIAKVKIDSDHEILETTFIKSVTGVSTIRCINGTDIYIGTWKDGLFYMNFDNPSVFSKVNEVPINDVYELFFDKSKNELWVAGSENIGLFKSSIVSTIHAVGENRVESISLDNQDHIYYSIGKQVFYLENLKDPSPRNILTTTETYFSRIVIDNSKLWVGDAFNNIFYNDLTSKTNHTLLKKQDNYPALYIFLDKNNNKWFSGLPDGLIRVDRDNNLKQYKSINQSILVRESRGGDVICGQTGKKNLLEKYNASKDTFQPLTLDFTFNSPPSIILNDFQFDSHDNIWLATNEGLLFVRYESGHYNKVERVAIPGLNTTEPIRALAIRNDYICFANSNELVIYKDGKYLLFNQDAGLPSKILKERGLSFDSHDNLLIATAKGMAVIEKDAIQFEQTRTPIFKNLLLNGEPINSKDSTQSIFPYKAKLEAEFISLTFPATNIQYQSKIKGIDSDWSAPSLNRNLNVLGFSEGTYTLEVRARENGKLWSEPLAFTFEVSKPWYRTWWALLLFVALAIVTVVVSTNIHNNNLIRQKKTLQKTVEERTDEVNRQKNELIEQQQKLIQQKEEIIAKNEAVYKSQQALNEADMNYLQLKERQLQEQIEHKNKQITTHALNILQKNETLTDLRNQLEEIVKNSHKISITEIRRTLKTIDESFKLDKDWDDFKLYFEQIHTGF
ncbi:MAG TPA: triple tyrosine motif-containing protein, partial [Cyclobacteriaceae bacterium]|nr:triple tyrosine motif-containing protein [Cyclobacteriaceae bacterium]